MKRGPHYAGFFSTPGKRQKSAPIMRKHGAMRQKSASKPLANGVARLYNMRRQLWLAPKCKFRILRESPVIARFQGDFWRFASTSATRNVGE
ncbi:hypothetical protein Y5S_02858 [Alcanivorax nanhaiticus]|uniref:Uncharacterized protein n=1 Tax=Alcanivorax nanhaiticus TaxID=1177154 RepID=A0A095TN59_9GAMM|nr:hypothetical protein Y5S_02858 [Alcanivorax nanhaiticus]